MVDLSRADLEALIRPLVEKVVSMVEDMWRKHGPHKLLTVGGSSRIPLLRALLSRKVREPERLRSCPEDAVVVGSALYARQGKERLIEDRKSVV